MKIVHVISGLKNGGAEAILFRIVNNDKTNNHVIISLGYNNDFYAQKFLQNETNIYFLNINDYFSFIKAVFDLRNLIKIENPNLVQTWMYHSDLITSLASFFLNHKIVYGIHSTFLDIKHSKKSTRLIIWLLKYFSRFIPKVIICCSDVAMQSHIKIGYPENKLTVINNGIDTHKFFNNLDARYKIRNSLDILDNTILFGMIARWDRNKNHEMLFRALSDFKKVHLKFPFKILLAGENMSYENINLLNLLKTYNILEDSILINSVDNISDYINALDLHILTSNSESFGNATAECLACGIDVITTDVGLCQKFIQNGYGSIIKTNSFEELKIAIINFLNKREQFKNDRFRKDKLRNNIVDFFSQNRMIKEYNNLWKKIINNERV